jgi:pilus assembly protein CpaB
LRVLATDQSATQGAVEGKTKVKAFSTVTVEVTPKIAEKIAVAQTIGTLSLSLRSPTIRPSWSRRSPRAMSRFPPAASPQDEEKLLKQALAHPLDGGTSFATGGDVSRFQRKSMPPMGAGGSGGFTAPPAPAPATAVAGPVAPPRPRGPVVNITRGKETVTVSVGGQ